jgi:hypothetical protein
MPNLDSYCPDADDATAASSHQPSADVKAQKAFEKELLAKTAKQTGDIILFDNRIVLVSSPGLGGRDGAVLTDVFVV